MASWVSLTLVILAAGLGGGPGFAPGSDLVRSFAHWRGGHPDGEAVAASITHVGGGAFLLLSAGLASVALGLRKRWSDVVALLVVTVGGRLLVELVKFVVARPRPIFGEHPVYTTNYSFPSGHAGNSMMTFLALAWFLSPPQRRRANLLLAVIASVIIGSTRPVLGVHWPSDIIAGWALGILWVWLVVAFTRRGETAA